MERPANSAASRSVDDLTAAFFGRRMSLGAALAVTEKINLKATSCDEGPAWVGSIGYERFSSNAEFAKALVSARVDTLIDVRDLPISRKRGFAKTALSEAVAAVGIDYQHWKPLGNPKEIRDLYKSGQIEEGRKRYERHLADREVDIQRLDEAIESGRRIALMCVEHDESVCHRRSILEALSRNRSGRLRIAQVAKT